MAIQQGMNQQTPAVKSMLQRLGGIGRNLSKRAARSGTGRSGSKRRRTKRKAASASSSSKKRRAGSGRKSKLTKGSAAAKKRMAQLRSLRMQKVKAKRM